jgi:hypothetical protein
LLIDHFFYNCSKEYVELIDHGLFSEINDVIRNLPKRNFQAEVNGDLFWSLTQNKWAYDSMPQGLLKDEPNGSIDRVIPQKDNKRYLCSTSTTLDASWHSDYAQLYPLGLVQLEVQFGKVESMFKDFCGFRIAYFERRLTLGIEIVMSEPSKYFAHRKSAVSGMAYFDIAKRTLPAIGLDCPIWLIGLKE